MSSDWKPDGDKFNLPASRGNVAVLAIITQRLGHAVEIIASSCGTSGDPRIVHAQTILDDIRDSLEKLQIKLVGPDEDQK